MTDPSQRPDDVLLTSIIIFTDGAASGNPGPGGWAAVIRSPQGDIRELGGAVKDTTNNRMELRATIEALECIAQDPRQVVLFTDSTYVIRGITQWIWGWRKRGWKTSNNTEVTNKDLWQRLFKVAYDRQVRVIWRYVRGHNGSPGNERCDTLAVDFTKNRRPRLYAGPEARYDVDLTLLPPDEGLPEMKSRDASKKKAKAHSYLSVVDGHVSRHATWAECERRVKGRSGARFKKAKSAQDERVILKSWGLSEDALDG